MRRLISFVFRNPLQGNQLGSLVPGGVALSAALHPRGPPRYRAARRGVASGRARTFRSTGPVSALPLLPGVRAGACRICCDCRIELAANRRGDAASGAAALLSGDPSAQRRTGFGAWRDALTLIENVTGLEGLIIVNDSIFGPLQRISRRPSSAAISPRQTFGE
jgi:hypothetical protein